MLYIAVNGRISHGGVLQETTVSKKCNTNKLHYQIQQIPTK